MTTAEQAARRFQAWAALAAFAVALAAAIFAAAALPFVDPPQAYLFIGTNLFFLLALALIPNWLHGRPGFLVRGIVWQAILRWCALLVAAAYWWREVRPDDARQTATCLGALAVVNIVAAGLGGRHWHHHDFSWSLYFAGDFILLVYLVGKLDSPLLFALIATLSAFLLIFSAGHGPRMAVAFVGGLYTGLLYGGTGWMRGHAIFWFAVVVLATFGVSRLAAQPRAVTTPAAPPPEVATRTEPMPQSSPETLPGPSVEQPAPPPEANPPAPPEIT
ncbi:MAG TPA: hypothetical protein VFU76_05475 [Terriglobales bacterium]|nr:hypothetical protein [Terriglobales bacterium]